MSSGTLLLSVGVLLLVSCALGGGFEIKEIKIPKIGAWSRAIAGIFGVGLLVLGLAMSPEFSSSTATSNQAAAESAQENNTLQEVAPTKGAYQDHSGYQDQNKYQDQNTYQEQVADNTPSTEDLQAESSQQAEGYLVPEQGETTEQQEGTKSIH